MEKSSSQETERILTLTNALAATTIVMDVTRSGDGAFENDSVLKAEAHAADSEKGRTAISALFRT